VGWGNDDLWDAWGYDNLWETETWDEGFAIWNEEDDDGAMAGECVSCIDVMAGDRFSFVG